jgi:hypothetical protein
MDAGGRGVMMQPFEGCMLATHTQGSACGATLG